MATHLTRFWKFADVPETSWSDWKWQLAHSLTSTSRYTDYFPQASRVDVERFALHAAKYNIALTPYLLSLIEMDGSGNPMPHDPIWLQFGCGDTPGPAVQDYHPERTNWELGEEFPTPLLHHKYDGRAIIRLVNHCLGYCRYCYLTARVLDRSAPQPFTTAQLWQQTIEWLRVHPEVHDVLLSGGDPLLLPDNALDRYLGDLRAIVSVKTIRLNTRALTFNPFRITPECVAILARHGVTVLEVHFSHPRELTGEVEARLRLFDTGGCRPLVLWRAPLLRGINDSVTTLEELLVKLYRLRITPYYLFHYAPNTLERSQLGVSVKRGVALLQSLRRTIPGPAFPRFTLFHPEGKQDIPLESKGTPDFCYEQDPTGAPLIRFRNWRGNWVVYPDVNEAAPGEDCADVKSLPESALGGLNS